MSARHSLLIIGAFPDSAQARNEVQGGMLQSCRLLQESSLPQRVQLSTVDTTQISVPPPSLPVRIVLGFSRFARCARLIEARRPRFVMAFASGGGSFIDKSLLLAYARLRGARTMMFLRHGAMMDQFRASSLRRAFARILLAGVTVHLCQSATWRKFFVDDLRLSATRCRIVENWTVTPPLLRIGESRRADEQRGGVHFLYLGWLETRKGVMDLLHAFRDICAHAAPVDARLTIAGGGKAESECRVFIEQHGLHERVHMAGWVSGEQKLELLRRCEVFVLPSYAEGLSNALLEAMAAGLAPIVTRVGSLPDVITHAEDGLLVPPGDITALAAAMARLVTHRDEIARMATAAHRRAKAFDVERAVRDLVQVMDDFAE